MSVYTTVSRDELQAFLTRYPVGELVSFEGISAGIENTNYFVDTLDGRWVLTLFERQEPGELPYFLGLMDHLARRGIPTASPLEDCDGVMLGELCGKPAALVHRLTGASVMDPDAGQCAALGTVLGDMHLAGQSYRWHRRNGRGRAWWKAMRNELQGHLNAADAALLDDEIAVQDAFRPEQMPQGVIHADLFCDNALFESQQVSGLIDFYYACDGVLIYDLAIVVNDWCLDDDGRPQTDRWTAMVDAYAAERAFSAAENDAWPILLRAAALRFWVSRLFDLHFPRDGELTHTKDPDEFRRILVGYREHGCPPLPVAE